MNDDVRQALAAIEVKGRLTPDDVVEAAKDKASVLHSYFEWDNKKAGAEYRLQQARDLLRSYKVVVTTINYGPISVPVYVRDPDVPSEEQGYVSLRQAATEEDTARNIVVREFRRAAEALSRARTFAAVLIDIPSRIDEIQERLVEVRRSVEAHPTA